MIHRLVLVLVAVLLGCGPPAPAQPPPTTAAPRYEPCGDGYGSDPYVCHIQVARTTDGGTAAHFWLVTHEPPTMLSWRVNLEKKQPSGAFVSIWTEQAATGPASSYEDYSATIACGAGLYRWRLEASFASARRTVFTHATPVFAVTA